jgi:hypothetical protein
MLFSNACAFLVLFSVLSLSTNAETVRGAQRELIGTERPVDLGGAGDYAILAKTGIDSVPASDITGDIGVSAIAATAITGFALTMDPSGEYSTDNNDQINPGVGETSGKAYAADYAEPTPTKLTAAILDMEDAYTDAAGRTNLVGERKNVNGGILNGDTLTPGVYTFTTNVHLTGDITFRGDFSDIFIIQITGNLKQDAGKKVILLGGARPENIFWQIAGNVAVLSEAHMEGILLVKTDVTFVTGSSLDGRVLTQTACNLQIATITQPVLIEDSFP